MNGATASNGFVILWAELKRRFLTPVRHVTFWVYLILGVLTFGGLAIWLEIYLYFTSDISENASHIRIALVGFFPALIGSVSFQLIFEEAGRNKRMLALALIVVVLFALVAGFLIVRNVNDQIAIPIASASCAFAVLVWWISNGLNPTFQDDLNVEAPVGGSPDQTLSGDPTDYTR